MGFNDEWKKAVKETEDKIEKTMRATVISLFNAIVLSTPVGNPKIWKYPAPKDYRRGRLRANWQLSLDAPIYTEVKGQDKSGRATRSKAKQKMRTYKLDDTVYFTNNLDYAELIETGQHSKQAPQGMVAINVKKFNPKLEKLARRLLK